MLSRVTAKNVGDAFLRHSVVAVIYVHSEFKKLCHNTFIHNFEKYWPIFKILSLLYSPGNLQ